MECKHKDHGTGKTQFTIQISQNIEIMELKTRILYAVTKSTLKL